MLALRKFLSHRVPDYGSCLKFDEEGKLAYSSDNLLRLVAEAIQHAESDIISLPRSPPTKP